MVDEKLWQRFANLFNGLQRAYGLYTEPDPKKPPSKDGKRKGRGRTISAPITAQQWVQHLDGEQRMGVIPIRDDDTVLFGAIDIDDYNIGAETIAQRASKFPLVVTRSKSGGVHLWVFLTEPAPAALVRGYLQEWAVALGFPTAEIFPKQDVLAGPTDVGNWIHVPYYDHTRTMCYGLRKGNALPLPDWLSMAEKAKLSIDDMEAVEVPVESGMEGAPPCLVTLTSHGVPEGSRNAALFALGVLAKKQDDANWANILQEYNQRFLTPPLPLKEVTDTIKGLGRKDYFYPCSKPPLVTVCNKALCRLCEHGIGGTAEDPGIQIDSITKVDSDPPHYFLQVNNHRIEIPDADILLNQNKFRKAVFQTLDIVPNAMRPQKWAQLLNSLMQQAVHVEAPEDAGTFGQFYFHLATFCTGIARARDRAEILQGKPWTDENGWTWFRSVDLLAYLERQKFRAYRPHQIWAMLRERVKCRHRFVNANGAGCNVWGVPRFDGVYAQQTEPFEVPRAEGIPTTEESNSFAEDNLGPPVYQQGGDEIDWGEM